MQEALVFAGFGGQGVMFAGQIMTYAAMDSGLHVTWIPSYGPEMRGGTAYCFVVLGDEPIGSPIVRHPQTAIIFNQPSYDKFVPMVAPGGFVAYNASMITPGSPRNDLTELAVKAVETADEIGDRQLTNMVLLGAALTAHPLLPLEAIEQALRLHLPARHQHRLQKNFTALERGAALANDIMPPVAAYTGFADG